MNKGTGMPVPYTFHVLRLTFYVLRFTSLRQGFGRQASHVFLF